MNARLYLSSRYETERVIAGARVVLAASGLFAVWMDLAEPIRYTAAAYALHSMYVLYSLGLLAFISERSTSRRLSTITHLVDIVLFSVFQSLTLGPSSPFFVYFIFSLFCGAIRWGWRGALGTAAIVVVAFLGMGASMSRTLGPIEFDVNRFIMRLLILVVTAGLLVYLGRYEDRLRDGIERLARWPSAAGADMERTVPETLAHAARIVGAGRAAMVWEGGEEPTVYVSEWSDAGSSLTTHAPEDLKPLVAAQLEGATFVTPATVAPGSVCLVSDARAVQTESIDAHLHPLLQRHLRGVGLASAPFRTERVAGRVFFADLGAATGEIVPLTEVVARELGASLDQLHTTKQLQEIAAGEERIRVARDLHDGVLQSLTGIRLEIRSVADVDSMAPDLRDRLFAMERALAIEQRELRLFIAELEPHIAPRNDTPLAARLNALRERIALEWKAPVSMRVTTGSTAIPERLEQAVPLMVHEAVVNALKHGQPSRVAVTVDGTHNRLRIVVSDDGRGFAFRGRYDHAALMQGSGMPKSLLNRVTELGGEMSIESSDAGARVEMRLAF